MPRHPKRRAPELVSGALYRDGITRCVAIAIATLMPNAALAVTASTNFICSLVGEGTHNGTNPTSAHQPNLQLHGTDLGFSFKHGNRVWMLFGDTWVHDDFICQVPAPVSDDAVGRINLWQDDDPDDCLDVHFPVNASDEVRPLRVFDGVTELPMGALRTPITGWSDNVHPYGYFIGEPNVPCALGEREVCPDGLQCHANGFCYDPQSSGGLTMLYPQNFAVERLIAVSRLPVAPNRFRVGYRFATNKFFNATTRVVRRFNEHNPKANIYEPTDSPRELLMWGRPSFLAFPPNSSSVYLLHHRLKTLDGPGTSVDWAPRYFAGLDAKGDPTWTDDQVAAAPVIDNETIIQVQQFSVAWVEPIERFVMLYSGRFPRVPATDPGTGFKSGIFMRTAEHPWGPWSAPLRIWNADDENAYDCPYENPGIMYHQGAVGISCPVSEPYRPNWPGFPPLNNCPAVTPTPHEDFGVEYGVNILDTFTKPGLAIDTAVIYWNMSTWNPYHVVLMRTLLDDSVIVSP